MKRIAAVLVVALLAYQPCLVAASIPSKTANDQALADLTADLIFARSLFATDRIAKALEAEGLTTDQIESRLAVLSTADLISLGGNPAQLRSAGVTMSKKMWTAIGIGAAAVVVGGLALTNDDGEDDDSSDDGED